jgi:hypothetical protein
MATLEFSFYKNIMIEYYKNLSVESLFYINDNGLVCLEEWRDIPGFIGFYQASNLGRIKILKRKMDSVFYKNRFTSEKIKKQCLSKQNYLCVSTVNSKKEQIVFNVHVLVGMAFLGHYRCGYVQIIDHKKPHLRHVNRPFNLQVITQRENSSKDKINKTSIYTGVFKRKDRRTWVSSIRINKDKIIIGNYLEEIDAYKSYCIALDNIKYYKGDKKAFRNLIKSLL